LFAEGLFDRPKGAFMNRPSASTAAGIALVSAAITAVSMTLSVTSWSGWPATAAPDPCAASQIAKTIGVVAANTGSYLEDHPQTNQALTAIAAAPAGPQSLVAAKAYFDANAQAGKDLQTIQLPLTTLSGQCKLPVSLPQLLGLIQAAQTQTAPSAAPPAAGPLPGPAPKAG
jgi:hemophore